MQLVKKAKRMFLGGIASVVIFGIAGNFICLNIQQNQLKELSSSILSHAGNVASQITSSMMEAGTLGISQCNDANLEKLRQIIWKYPSVQDIGVTDNHKLLCTANWGVLTNPVDFSQVSYVLSQAGYSLFNSQKGLLPYGIEMNMTIKNNIAAFTSPFAFKDILASKISPSFFLASKNGQHTFFSYHPSPENTSSSADKITLKNCSSRYDFCVFVTDSKKGIFSLSMIQLILLAFLGFALGSTITYVVISFLANSHSIEFRFKKAILQEKLYLEYQPLVHVKTKKIVGVEALLRWNDKVFGQVSPDLFISISEKIGIYSNVSAFVCAKAIEDMSAILRKHREMFLSINIGKTEINDHLFLDKLLEKAKLYKILPYQIKIEITERSNDSYKSISEFSINAKNKGFMVSLDDFGTGASNLIWLTEINFDEIKLDKFFVSGLKNKYKKAILMAVLNALAGLNKRIVFEGVETKEDFEFVQQYNDNALIQGWYFYKSLPINKLREAILISNKPDEDTHFPPVKIEITKTLVEEKQAEAFVL